MLWLTGAWSCHSCSLQPVVGVGVSQTELALWWPGHSSLKPVAEVAAL